MWFLFGNPTPLVRLTGPRVVLRPPARRDAEAWSVLRRQSQDFLQPWEPVWPPDGATRTAFQSRRTQILEDWKARTGYGFLIFQRDDGALLGGITLSHVRRGVASTGTLGYWIGGPHARRGYMTEAVGCVLDFAFGEIGLHRVEAACLSENEASQRLLLKSGFSEEGLARGYLKINGRWRDHRTFAVLKEDLRASRSEEADAASGVSGIAGKR